MKSPVDRLTLCPHDIPIIYHFTTILLVNGPLMTRRCRRILAEEQLKEAPRSYIHSYELYGPIRGYHNDVGIATPHKLPSFDPGIYGEAGTLRFLRESTMKNLKAFRIKMEI